MKLVFSKDEEANVVALCKDGDQERPFSYVEMIMELINGRELEDPEIRDGFSDAEQKSIQQMVTFINHEVAKTDEDSPSE